MRWRRASRLPSRLCVERFGRGVWVLGERDQVEHFLDVNGGAPNAGVDTGRVEVVLDTTDLAYAAHVDRVDARQVKNDQGHVVDGDGICTAEHLGGDRVEIAAETDVYR